MDTNCTKYLVEYVSEHYDSAEHIFDPLFKFALDHQSFFSEKPLFTEDSFATLTKLHSLIPSDDISSLTEPGLLTWRADKALEFIESEFEKNQYPASTFFQYLEDYADDILKSGKSETTNGACLAALLFKSPLPEHISLKSRLGSELFTIFSKSKASEIIDILAAAAPQKLEGPENDFIRALNNINQISNTWRHMKIADLSSKVKLKEVPNKLSDKEFFEVYGGNYALIPKCAVDPNFSKLSEAEQNAICVDAKENNYVKSFLIANFPKFHSLLDQNARIVYSHLKNANISNFMNETKKYSSKLSYYSSDASTLKQIFNSVQHVNEAHKINYLSDMVNAIVDGYLPSVQRFRNSRVFNNSLASVMVSSGSNSLLLGAAVYLQQPVFKSSYSQNSSPSTSQPEVIQKYIDRNSLYCGSFYGGDSESSKSFLDPTQQTADTLTTKHFNKLIEIQKRFNSKFITEYRKFLDILVNVPDTDFKNNELPILQEMIGQFNKVLIRKGQTVIKLTGVQSKSLNKEYVATCQGLIDVLNKRHMQSFMSLIPILQNIIKICNEVADETKKERDDYFFAKKTPIDFETYENLQTKLEREYIHFTKEDSVKISDIVARFRDFLSSKIVPKGEESTYSRLKEYISKLSNRNEAINRYFDEIIDNMKFYQSQQYSTSSSKILNPVINLATALINEHRKAYIWLNEKIDSFEVNDRIKQLKNRTFSEAELEKIANAYVEFNKYIKLNANKLGNKYKHFMLYEPKNVCNFFKCYQLARETVEEIGSVNYLERLYKILGIIDTSSEEWAQFKIGLTNYLALSTIWFDVYRMKVENPGENEYRIWTEIEKEKKATKYDDIDSRLNKYDELRKGRTYKLLKSLNDIITCSDEQMFGHYLSGIDDAGLKNLIKNGTIRNPPNEYYNIFTEYGAALLQIIENKTIYNPYYVVGFSMRQKKNFNPIGENGDKMFYITVLKSLYVPVLQQLDKYIRIRHTGSFKFSTNVSKLMMGGENEGNSNEEISTKQKAGSVYDYTNQHFDKVPEVIPEAFKFYVCGYAIIKYYFIKLEEIRQNKDHTTMSVEFNKRSNFATLKEKDIDEIKLVPISANEYNLRAFLKIMNKYWNAAVGSNQGDEIDNKTTKAIEMICAEFNNLIVFGDINDLKKIRDGTEHEIDLDKQARDYQKLHDDIHKFIDEASLMIMAAGVNYDILLRDELNRGAREMTNSVDKYGTLRKWIENVDKPKNVESEERKLFIDVFLSPIFTINAYWARYINTIKFLPKYLEGLTDTNKAAILSLFSRAEAKPFISSLIKYGKFSAKTVGDIIKLSLQEYYEDMDNAIHHILGYKGFSEQAVKLLVDEVHEKFKEMYDNMIKFFNSPAFNQVSVSEVLPFISISVPQFSQTYIEQNVWKKGITYNDSYIKFRIAAFDEVKTFTQFITVALSRLSGHKYLPQFYVDALKSSELLNNTFSEIRTMGTNVICFFGMQDDRSDKAMTYNEEIIDVITSALIYWSSSQLAIETDSKVASQTYKNKVVALIPILLYILEVIYKKIDDHHEEYLIQTGASWYSADNKKTRKGPGDETVNRTQTNWLQNSRTIRINAKSEITILKNILKGLYAEFLPTATKMTFMNSGSIQSDHYLCEVRKLMEDDKLKFVDILENPEKFEWIFPLGKIDAGVEYIESRRFERYYKLIDPITIDADFKKSFEATMQVMAKVLVYNILDSLEYSLNKINENSFSGGNLSTFASESSTLNGGEAEETSIEKNILNANQLRENKEFNENVIPDLKQANVKINNVKGNLITSEINGSTKRLNSKAMRSLDKRGQVLSVNQQAALLLYRYFKRHEHEIDFKNLNIDLLIKSKILDNFDDLYLDGDNKFNSNDNQYSIKIGNTGSNSHTINMAGCKLVIQNEIVNGDPQDVAIVSVGNNNTRYEGGDSKNMSLEHTKEILQHIIMDIQYYTSKSTIQDYYYLVELIKLTGYSGNNFNYSIEDFNYIKNNLKFDIKSKGTNINTLTNAGNKSQNGFNIHQFIEFVDVYIKKLNETLEVIDKYTDDNELRSIRRDQECSSFIVGIVAIVFSNANINDEIYNDMNPLLTTGVNRITKNMCKNFIDGYIKFLKLILGKISDKTDVFKYLNIPDMNIRDLAYATPDHIDRLGLDNINFIFDTDKKCNELMNEVSKAQSIAEIKENRVFIKFRSYIETLLGQIRRYAFIYNPLLNDVNAMIYVVGDNVNTRKPNYYQIWKLIENKGNKNINIHRLKNYLLYLNNKIGTAGAGNTTGGKLINVANARIYTPSLKVKTKETTGLATFPKHGSKNIIKDLYDIIGNDKLLTSIINNDCLWCVILAAIILRSNYGMINKVLVNQLRTLSNVIYTTYALQSENDNKNIHDCINNLINDKYVIDGDTYYNTDFDIHIRDLKLRNIFNSDFITFNHDDNIMFALSNYYYMEDINDIRNKLLSAINGNTNTASYVANIIKNSDLYSPNYKFNTSTVLAPYIYKVFDGISKFDMNSINFDGNAQGAGLPAAAADNTKLSHIAYEIGLIYTNNPGATKSEIVKLVIKKFAKMIIAEFDYPKYRDGGDLRNKTQMYQIACRNIDSMVNPNFNMNDFDFRFSPASACILATITFNSKYLNPSPAYINGVVCNSRILLTPTREALFEDYEDNNYNNLAVYQSSILSINNPKFLQNAFVYEPYDTVQDELADCYSQNVYYIRDDRKNGDSKPSTYYLIPYDYSHLNNNIYKVRNDTLGPNNTNISDLFNNFTTFLSRGIDTSKFNPNEYERDMNRLVGGDLYTVDSKELLKEYEKAATVYDSFIQTTHASLFTLITAYYANIILGFNVYFNKSTFIEILYNAEIFNAFFGTLADDFKGYTGNVPEKLKVLLSLMMQTSIPIPRPVSDVNEPMLTTQQIKDNYYKNMWANYPATGTYYEPSAIRRFLEMTYNPHTETNIPKSDDDQKLVRYIIDCQGGELLQIIMNFERLNLKVGALFQFIKEFEYIPMGDEYESTKYTKNYKDDEVFDGSRPGDSRDELFDGKRPTWH